MMWIWIALAFSVGFAVGISFMLWLVGPLVEGTLKPPMR